MSRPMTRHRCWVRQQLEWWENWPDSVHLLFVRKLVEELSEQLDVAHDASSRHCNAERPLAENCAAQETVVVKDGEPAVAAPLFLPCGTAGHCKAERPLAENCAAQEAVEATEGALPVAARLFRPSGTTQSNAILSDTRITDIGKSGSDSPVLEEHVAMQNMPGTASLQLPIPANHGNAGGDLHGDCPVAAMTPAHGPAGTAESPERQHETRPGRKSGGGDSEASTRLPDDDSSDSDIDEESTGEEWAPYDLLMPNLLPFLSVQELLNWRRLSQLTRSPKALIAHVAEVGSMDRPEKIVAFVEQMNLVGSNPDTPFAAVFEGDAEQQKFYECRRWCTVLASKRKTHFVQIHVQRVVGKNLRSLLQHCRSSDVAVADAALLLVMNHAAEALHCVQGRIAKTMLGMTEELVESNISANRDKILFCLQNLGMVLRALTKPQRQKWVSLLVKLLMDEDFPTEQVIWRLRLLWLADDDPLRTYSEAQRQMKLFEKTNSDWEVDIQLLLQSSCS
ncbi:unnamed protein product [Symbiodinium sp. CCMP2592]|nr:unnamed protein product [Symbiodinium sp. CCMP2592]